MTNETNTAIGQAGMSKTTSREELVGLLTQTPTRYIEIENCPELKLRTTTPPTLRTVNGLP